MTCNDCIHYKVCKKTRTLNPSHNYATECNDYDDCSRFVKLPCSTSETLFVIENPGKIIIDKIETIITIGYDEDFSQSQLDCYSGKRYYVKDIGKTIFFTKEEAEAALKENGGR